MHEPTDLPTRQSANNRETAGELCFVLDLAGAEQYGHLCVRAGTEQKWHQKPLRTSRLHLKIIQSKLALVAAFTLSVNPLVPLPVTHQRVTLAPGSDANVT